jgi:transcription elongation GreA/GreB family factor
LLGREGAWSFTADFHDILRTLVVEIFSGYPRTGFAARVRTAQVIANPASTDTVAFGTTVTFGRDDGRLQKYRIVGEHEADPKAGSISFVSPVARFLMCKAVGDVVGTSGQELEIIAIS